MRYCARRRRVDALRLPPEQGRTDGKLGGAEPDQHVFVLTLPAEPCGELACVSTMSAREDYLSGRPTSAPAQQSLVL